MSWVDEGRKFGVIAGGETVLTGQKHILDTNMFGCPAVARGSLKMVANLAMSGKCDYGYAVYNHYVARWQAEEFLRGEREVLNWFRGWANDWLPETMKGENITLRQFIAMDATEVG